MEAGNQFTETPDAAFVDWKPRGAALAPQSSERGGVYSSWAPVGIYDLEQIATIDAAEILLGFLAHDIAANAAQSRSLNGIGRA